MYNVCKHVCTCTHFHRRAQRWQKAHVRRVLRWRGYRAQFYGPQLWTAVGLGHVLGRVPRGIPGYSSGDRWPRYVVVAGGRLVLVFPGGPFDRILVIRVCSHVFRITRAVSTYHDMWHAYPGMRRATVHFAQSGSNIAEVFFHISRGLTYVSFVSWYEACYCTCVNVCMGGGFASLTYVACESGYEACYCV